MLPLLLLTVLAALPDKPLLIESVAITGADLHGGEVHRQRVELTVAS